MASPDYGVGSATTPAQMSEFPKTGGHIVFGAGVAIGVPANNDAR
jgi:hypothetical protein